MEYIEKLSNQQQTIFDVMLQMAETKQNYLLSSEPRNIGKTTILNELSFTLQALGYDVYLLNQYLARDFYTNGLITLKNESYKGILHKNSVVLIDESRYSILSDLLDYCETFNIPVIGFTNFERNKAIIDNEENFKQEYECKWANLKDDVKFTLDCLIFKNETSL